MRRVTARWGLASAPGSSYPPGMRFILVLLGCAAALAQSPAALQKAAQKAMKSQLTREVKECPAARNSLYANTCTAEAEQATKADFDTFYHSLESLLAANPANVENLKASEDAWVLYTGRACDAVEYLFRGGTIEPSAVMRCRIQLMRSRMKDLGSLYETVLHH